MSLRMKERVEERSGEVAEFLKVPKLEILGFKPCSDLIGWIFGWIFGLWDLAEARFGPKSQQRAMIS